MTKKITAVISVLLIIAAMCGVYFLFGEKTETGTKTISITVEYLDSTSVSYSLSTDAEFLKQAMDEADGLEYSGTEGPYGIMVNTVNGEYANFNETGSYWGFSVNGEYCNYGIDTQPVNDGDAFLIKNTKA